MYRHIFGPVLSRRLKRSLGVDLLPFKTCTYSCVYCECGATTDVTTERLVFFPAETVIAELDRVLAGKPQLDFITFAGSGEPTLSLSIGPVIAHIRDAHPGYPIAVLTNGSLFFRQDVRDDLIHADLVIPTLTTTSQKTFKRIHRPHPSLRVNTIITGLEQFRKMYSHAFWLEVFIIPGLNTSETELTGLKKAIERMHPDRVQINTLDRPPAEGWVRAAPPAELERIRNFLDWPDTDIISRAGPSPNPHISESGTCGKIRSTLQRRPSTVEDLVRTTGLSGGAVIKILAALEQEGMVVSQQGVRGVFYRIRRERTAEQ